MLVDDAFTYVVGTQGGQVRTRIAGQPALITVVADVMAGSVFKSAIDDQRAQMAAERRANAQNNESQSAPTRQPRTVTPVEPIRPAEPATPPTINNPSSNQNSSTDNRAPTEAAKKPTPATAPKAVPNDESIDMVIIEDESATY